MTKNAGYYKLESFRVQALDSENAGEAGPQGLEMKKLVHTWSISESINNPYISGSAQIFESSNALKKIPLRGEESLSIKFTDYFDKEFEYKFYVYAITDLKSEQDKLMSYMIHFTSFQKLESDKAFVRKSFGEESISTMAQQVFERYFPGDKEIVVEETQSKQTLVIPRLRPDEAMTFLARRADTSNSPSSLFNFFETREKYYFATHEKLVEENKELIKDESIAEKNNLKFIYRTNDDNTVEGQRLAQFSLSNLSYIDRSNTIKALKQGAYKRAITELDYNNKLRVKTVYNYLEEQGKFEVIDKLTKINSSSFIDRYMLDEEAPELVYVTDYNQQGVSQGKDGSLAPFRNYSQNFMTKSLTAYHLANSSVSCTIFGQGRITPGVMIYLEVYEFAEVGEESIKLDTERSGPYMVMDVFNSFAEDIYKQTLTITKGGLRATTS